jgi:hypothetical protein
VDENELLYDRATNANFGTTDAERFVSLIAAAYTNLYGSFGSDGSIMRLEEVPTMRSLSHRGPDWGDGGHWVRFEIAYLQAQRWRTGKYWNFCLKE